MANVDAFLDIAVAVTVLAGVVVAVARFSNKRLEHRIVETIVSSTQQIKTDTNGGQSLNDVNKKVNKLQSSLEAYIQAQERRGHQHDMQHQEIKYELAAIKRIASYPAEGE